MWTSLGFVISSLLFFASAVVFMASIAREGEVWKKALKASAWLTAMATFIFTVTVLA